MEDQEDKVKQKKMNKTYTVARNKISGAASASVSHDDSLIVIPDTPSPVFSRFAGKRERFPDLDRSRLDFVRKKPKTSNDSSLNLPLHNSSQSIYDISSQTGSGSSNNSRNLSKNNGEFSTNLSPKYFKNSHQEFSNDKNKNEIDERSKYFNNLWDECMHDADTATKIIVKSPKKTFKLKNRRKLLNFDNDKSIEEKESESGSGDRSRNQKSRIETVTQDMDVDISQGSSRETFDSGHMSTNHDKELFSNKRLKTEDSGISNKFAQLRMARQSRMNRLLDKSDSGSSDEFLQLPVPQRKSSPKVNLYKLCWPSESESDSDSDSDNSDTIPLREILGENMSKKKKNNFKNFREQSIKNKTSVHNCVAKGDKPEDSKRNHFISKKDVKEKYFTSPKLPTKHSTASSKRNLSDLDKQGSHCLEGGNAQIKDRVRHLSEPDVSIISVSSTDSHTLAADRSHDLGNRSHDQIEDMEDVSILTAPEFSPLPQDSANSFRPTFVSPRLPVPISIRRGRHSDRRPERYVEDSDLTPSIIISSQVQTSSNVSPPARDLRAVSPHVALNRSRLVRSHKGRLPRPPRNVNRERVTSPGTDFTFASALMSPGTFNTTQQIRQHEADEDFARRLQEEMDMEFALSLHNMENRPPVEHTSGGGAATTDDDSDTRNEQLNTRSRMYGLEDIEAFLHLSDDSGPTSNLEQMLRASMTTTPPRIRNRQRGSRRQRNTNSLEALNRMEAHLMSILDEYGTPPVRGQGRQGRRFFPSPGDDGQDYEELLNLAEMIGEVKQRGLTKHQLTKLPERKYQLCPGEDVKECLVCMSEFEDKDKLRILPCFHEFHTPCIDKWIMGNATCPVCRVEVRV